MKTINALVFLFFLLTTIACSKETTTEMMIIKDCTGSYLRVNGLDYHICNLEFVDGFENGEQVVAAFEKIESCANSDNGIECQEVHLNAGWVNIVGIVDKE